MNRIVYIIVAAMLLPIAGKASDLVEILPLTDRIIMLHFSDGYVEHICDDDHNDVLHREALDIKKAARLENYTISSPDDAAYRNAVKPKKVGRKSKGTDFTRTWPPIQPHVMDHWIYLELPKAMQRGKTYTIDLNGLATNQQQATLTYNEFNCRSEAIHVNQIGYEKNAPKKYAYVFHWMGDLGPLNLDDYHHHLFYIFDVKRQEPVWVGKMRLRKDLETGGPETKDADCTPYGNFSGADVWECEFTQFKGSSDDTDNFVLVVEGIGCSQPFRVKQDIYREVFYHTCRGLYHQRAGIERKAEHTRWTKPRDHHPAEGDSLIYTARRWMDATSEGDNLDSARAKAMGPINTWGWYHDAGDWDGYAHHAGVPALLLTTYEMAPENFADGELNIPESGNGIPDLLDESAWLIDYYMRTKGPTGGIAGGRVHADFFKKPDCSPSYEDDRTWYVYGEDPVNSFKFAGLAAHLAYCLGMAGVPDSAKIYIEEAEKAYEWALKNTLPNDDVRNERLYAAAWLYKYTGKSKYQTRFKTDNRIETASDPIMAVSGFYNKNWQLWAVWAYATTKQPDIDKTLRDTMIQLTLNYADTANVKSAETRSCRAGFPWWFPTVVGQATTPWVMESIVAYELSGDPKYLECIYNTCDYMLGANPLNMCWITGLGDHHPHQILHLDSWYDGIEQMIPGIPPYGPVFEGNRGDNGFNGPWDGDFARATVYPDERFWPIHELWFENRYCPITNEYTIHQNCAPAAATYGYLCKAYSAYTVNQEPDGRLLAPANNSEIKVNKAIDLAVEAKDDRGVMKVIYYADWHKIAESTQAPFDAKWTANKTGTYKLTAKIIDNDGIAQKTESITLTIKP